MDILPFCIHYLQMYESSFSPETRIRECKTLRSVLAAPSPRVLSHQGHPQCEFPEETFPHRWCCGWVVPPGPSVIKLKQTVFHRPSHDIKLHCMGWNTENICRCWNFPRPLISVYISTCPLSWPKTLGLSTLNRLLPQSAAFNYKILSHLHLPGQNSTRRSWHVAQALLRPYLEMTPLRAVLL